MTIVHKGTCVIYEKKLLNCTPIPRYTILKGGILSIQLTNLIYSRNGGISKTIRTIQISLDEISVCILQGIFVSEDLVLLLNDCCYGK